MLKYEYTEENGQLFTVEIIKEPDEDIDGYVYDYVVEVFEDGELCQTHFLTKEQLEQFIAADMESGIESL